jgi:hypothetical protein
VASNSENYQPIVAMEQTRGKMLAYPTDSIRSAQVQNLHDSMIEGCFLIVIEASIVMSTFKDLNFDLPINQFSSTLFDCLSLEVIPDLLELASEP